MGLIKAAVSTLRTGLSDQWKEGIHCLSMTNEVIMRRGSQMNQGTGSNTKGNPDVITNGSVIMVEENTCMFTIDNGKITNIVIEPGAYVFDSSSAPSIFAGQVEESLKDLLTRFTFGGTASTQQRVVYINLMPLPGIPFGTSTPMPYFDPTYNTSIDLRFHGTFEIQIPDVEMAVKFYNQVANKGSISGDMSAISIFKTEQYKKEFKQALMKSLNMLSNKGVRYSQISAYLDDLTHEAQEATKNNWFERGFKIINVAMDAVTLTDESKTLLGDRLKADTMLGSDVQRAIMAGSSARALEAAAGNESGAILGFLGMNMAQQAGRGMLGQFGEAPSTREAQSAGQEGILNTESPNKKTQVADTWECSCGATSNTKFCGECGLPKSEVVESNEWICSCGAVNSTKFCGECGKSR